MNKPWNAKTAQTAAIYVLAALGSVGAAHAQGFYIGESGGKIEVTGGGTASTYATLGTNDNIEGMVTDAANNLYVADTTAGNVYKISPGGAQTTIATGLMSPGDVAVDSFGNVYVANSAAGTVLRYAATGGAATTYASGLLMPEGITFGANGIMYVAEQGNGNTNSGQISTVPVGGGTATALVTGLSQPVALTLNTTGTSVYVVNSDGNKISGFSTANGAADNKYANLSLTGATGDLTMAPDGTLYVATQTAQNGTNAIYQVSADGTTATTYATANGNVYGFVYSSVVPEPSSWWALALGATGLLAIGRLRRRTA